MRLFVVVMVWLALGCTDNVYLGDNRRDVPDGSSAADVVVPLDVRGEVDAPPEAAPPDVQDASSPDIADAVDVADVVDLDRAEVDALPDAADDAAVDGVALTACEQYTRTRYIEVGGPTAMFDSEPANLPDTSCAVARNGAYLITRLTLRERAIVRIQHATQRTIAIRRACDDPTTELACGRVLAPQLLEAGTYYVLTEIDPTDPNRFVTATASPVTPFGTANNDTCEGATDLATLGGSTYDSIALTTAPRDGCLPFATGPARYYRATVPAGRRLVVSAAQGGVAPPDVPSSPGALRFGTTVRMFPSCAATTCLATASSGPGATATAAWTNTGTSSADVYVAVAAPAEATRAESVYVSSLLLTPTVGERCDAPDELRPGVTATVDLTTATERPAPCGDEHFPLTAARFLHVRVPARHTLDVFSTTAKPAALVRPWLRLYDRCGATTCLGDRWSWQTWHATGTLFWSNDSDVDRDLVLAVGAQVTGEGESPVPMTVDAAVRPIGAGQRCDAPIEVPVDGSTTVLSTEGSSVLLPRCDASTQPSFARFFRVTVPPRRTLWLDVAGGASGPPSSRIYQLDGCALTCPTLTIARYALNNTDAPRTVLFALTADQLGSTYRLRLTTTLRPIAPNTDCALASRLPFGVSHVPTSWVSPAPSPCPRVTNASFFRVEVPAHHVVRARASSAAGAGNAFIDRCGATSCLPGSPSIDFSDRSYPLLGAWTSNPSDSPREVIFVLSNMGFADPPTTPVVLEAHALARNATCADATLVTPGVDLLHEDAAGGGEAPSGSIRDTAAAVFYRAQVPAGQRVTFTVRRPAEARGPWFARTTLLTACGASLNGRLGPSVSWTNRDAGARDVYLAVATAAGHDGRFELSTRLDTPTPPDPCASAPTLTDGAELHDVDLPETLGYYLTAAEPQAFYRATIPAGETLAITTSEPTYAVFLTACGSGFSTPAADAARTHQRVNTTSAPQDVIVAIRAGGSAAVRVTLRAAIVGPSHTVETLAGSCDTLGGAPSVTGDEGVSAVQALPFAVPFFGETMRGYSVSTNGYMQLWPDLTGTPLQMAVAPSWPLPVAEAPTRLVAPFWDDLLPSTADAGVRAAVFETPRRHLTVEWRGYREWLNYYLASQHRTVQAWLFEDGVIEFHYCRAVFPGAPLRVTYGLQGPTAARWTAWQRPDSGDPVSANGALRFTPR